jgi:NLR family CARD domain-containing protein 3
VRASAQSEWTVTGWLAGLEDLGNVVSQTLLRPLGDEPSAALQLEFIRVLGHQLAGDGKRGAAAVLHLLMQDTALLERLSQELWRGIEKLAKAHAATARELQQKFVDAGNAFELSYGGIDTFFQGLEGLLGPPSSQLSTAMMREHCSSTDSLIEFTTANYGVTTTSRIEYHFVVDPEKGLGKLGRDSWPVEKKLLNKKLDGSEQTGSHSASSPREAKPLSAFEAAWAEIDEDLEGLNEYPLREEEFIGVRLYTGVRAAFGLLKRRWRPAPRPPPNLPSSPLDPGRSRALCGAHAG